MYSQYNKKKQCSIFNWLYIYYVLSIYRKYILSKTISLPHIINRPNHSAQKYKTFGNINIKCILTILHNSYTSKIHFLIILHNSYTRKIHF